MSRVPRLSLPSSQPQLPNLPGWRPNKQKARNLDHVFHYDAQNKAMLEVKAKPLDEFDEAHQTRYITSARSIGDHTPRNEGGFTPRFVEMDRKVLRFYAYFQQALTESAVETHRVRKSTILYYLVDDSMQVLEPREHNSGIPQGTLIKRHQIPRSRSDAGEGFITWRDLNIGEEITVYGRTFRIVSCDDLTRDYLASQGVNMPQDENYPPDGFRSGVKPDQLHAAPSIKIGDAEIYSRGNSFLKQYMEATLGKPVNHSEQLRQFLDNDRKVLRFFCMWDNRDQMFGDLRQYILHYFLSNDTIEILETKQPNDGRNFFPTLLKRQLLPKRWQITATGVQSQPTAEELKGASYKSHDLEIGSYISVFGRHMLLVDCDDNTREWYKKTMGRPQPPPIRVAETPVPPVRAPTPPYNGFGTEEDSRGSCISLNAKPPPKDFHKFLTNDKKLLRFCAKLVNCGPEGVNRRFVVTYYLADDTCHIYEPPQQNSGILGGRFLQRGKYKNIEGVYYSPKDFFVGAKITFNSYQFEILEADKYSVNIMARELGLDALDLLTPR